MVLKCGALAPWYIVERGGVSPFLYSAQAVGLGGIFPEILYVWSLDERAHVQARWRQWSWQCGRILGTAAPRWSRPTTALLW